VATVKRCGALGLDSGGCGSRSIAVRQRSWLLPYTDKKVEQLARTVAPARGGDAGFAGRLPETLEEIAQENAEIFRHNAVSSSPRSLSQRREPAWR